MISCCLESGPISDVCSLMILVMAYSRLVFELKVTICRRLFYLSWFLCRLSDARFRDPCLERDSELPVPWWRRVLDFMRYDFRICEAEMGLVLAGLVKVVSVSWTPELSGRSAFYLKCRTFGTPRFSSIVIILF